MELWRSCSVEPENGWDLASDGFAEFNGEQTQRLRVHLLQGLLAGLQPGDRVRLDGSVTDEPDDGTFHRKLADQHLNYSATQEWLRTLVDFLGECPAGISVC